MKLIDALVYGCARLTGGGDASTSRDLIRIVIDGGVRHFDAAPLYGVGTAERILGQIVGERADVRITTKVGLEPPRHAMLKTYARKLKRLVRPPAPILSQDFTPAAARASSGEADFDRAAMERSLARSLRHLRRDTIDVLLLHEAYRDDARPETLDFLRSVQERGIATEVGYSNGALFDVETDAVFPADFIAQTAMPVAWLGGYTPARPRLILHSLAKNWVHAKRSDHRLGDRLAPIMALADRPGLDPLSLELAALYALAHARLPEAQLIFTSTDRQRLAAFLSAAHHVADLFDEASLADLYDKT